MVDVDKLKEALAEFASYEQDGPLDWHEKPVVAAARLVVAGQPLWWCEEHQASSAGVQRLTCWVTEKEHRSFVKDLDFRACRMVEGWWMPTGDDGV